MKQAFAVSISLLIATLLSACGQVTSSPDSSPSISPSTILMDGVTVSSIEITANGSWELTTGANWLSAETTQGTGSAAVALKVEPNYLSPDRHDANVTVAGIGGANSSTLTFQFPKVAGTIIREEPSSANFEPQRVEVVPEGQGRLLVGLEIDQPAATPASFDKRAKQQVDGIPGLSLHGSYSGAGVAVYEAVNRRAAATALARNPLVRYVEPDHQLEVLATDDTHRSLQWGLDTIAVDNAWATSTGSGIRVAIIDSGFHPSHPDLAANVAYQYDFGERRTSVSSENANCGTHGNHVAGIVGAVTNNNEGVASVARDASLLLLDANDSSQETCPIYVSSLIAALDWIAGDGLAPNADIVNISLGASTGSQALHDAIKAAYDAGATIVAAAGNDPNTRVMYPAAYAEVIAVSATDPNDKITSYSTTGPEIWVSAPGGDRNATGIDQDSILSTVYSYSHASFGYANMDGTSMSTPAVAGVAALIKAANPNLTPRDIAHVLAQSSVDLGPSGWDDSYGHGRIDAGKAVELATTATASESAYILKTSDGRSLNVPEDGNFDLGYVLPGNLTLEAGSDDNLNGVLGESGEYYGSITLQIDFNGPQPIHELPVAKQP